ncbi:hypothetical protein BYT27DRAFT_7259370 [Phlegmacium glaucopus]|nr:hypothetical protein BYT27DRAFT_7259370 [Phlegmacium glaucopus]
MTPRRRPLLAHLQSRRRLPASRLPRSVQIVQSHQIYRFLELRLLRRIQLVLRPPSMQLRLRAQQPVYHPPVSLLVLVSRNLIKKYLPQGVISPQLTGVSKNTPSSSSPRSLPLGPIVGGALGALALLLLFIIFLIKCRPWKKEKSNRAETVPSSTVTPFSIQETPVGYFGSDDKTALAIAESSLSFTSGQSSHICSPRAQSDINDNPTANPQERDPLDPESLSTLTPENRASLAPSYSPDRRHFQSEFSDISTSCAADVPPAYHSLNIPSGLEARPNVEQIEEKIINCP